MSGGHGDGVLGRMIRRSREPLSALEPVIASGFAAPVEGFTSGKDPAFGPQSPDQPAADRSQPPAPRPGALVPGRLPLGDSGADIGVVPAPSRAAGSDGRSGWHGYRSPLIAAEDGTGMPTGANHPAPDGAAPPSGTGGTPSAPAFPPPARGLGPDAEAFAAGSARRSDLVPNEGFGWPHPGPPSRPASEDANWPGVPQADADGYPGIRATASVAAALRSGAGAPVTITIGHIEVRAAPAPQRPARQESTQRPRSAFQPQLGLADFLNDGAGRRRGDGPR